LAEVKVFRHGVAAVLPDARPFTRILKLCLLTGCRLGEVAEMDAADIVDGVGRYRHR
jgi:integrase